MISLSRFIKRQYIKHTTKVALLHIPKTEGIYVNQHESCKQPVIWPFVSLGHSYVVNKKEEWTKQRLNYQPFKTIPLSRIKKYKIISIVRNPFSWLVSYAGHTGAWPTKYFSTDHYDYKNAEKGFDYLVKTIINREDL